MESQQYLPGQQDNRNIKTTDNQKDNVVETLAAFLSYLLFVLTFPFSLYYCLHVALEYERMVIFRLGRLRKRGLRGPGLVFVLPCIEEWQGVDLRTATYAVPSQEILTMDSVTVQLDAVIYFRVQDPLKAVIQVECAEQSTRLLAQTTLRNITGTKMLTDLLSQKDQISHEIGIILDNATEPWGIKVERVEIKDIRLPEHMQRAMAAEQEAQRAAKAKVASADGELLASAALKEASDIMSANAVSLQLRYLQTLNLLSNKENQIYVLPYPIDMMKKIVEGARNQIMKAKLSTKQTKPVLTSVELPELVPKRLKVHQSSQTDAVIIM